MSHKISKKPPRFHQDDAIYFLTFCTFRRRKILHRSGVPEMLIETLMFYKSRIRDLIAFTIMTDHIHLMVDVENVKQMSDFLRDFKKWCSREVCRLVPISTPIWLRGTMDHCIRDDLDFHNHLSYIFYNSWKHLQVPPRDFPYHNFLEFVEKGWFDIDFLGLEHGGDSLTSEQEE